MSEINPCPSVKRQENLYRRYRHALRYSIHLGLTGLSFRSLSFRVADSQLFQWFTYTDSIGPIRPLSKSAIERFETLFSDEELTNLIDSAQRRKEIEQALAKKA